MLLGKFKVTGHSMQPGIKEGDMVVASSIPFIFSKPSLGDVIVFKIKGKVLIKRIKKEKNKSYLLEGDNPNDSLKIGWITQENILGKVILKI